MREFAWREGLIYNADEEAPKPRAKPLPIVQENGDPVERTCGALKAAAVSGGCYFLVVHPALMNEEMKQVWNHASPPGQQAEGRYWDYRLMVDPRVLKICQEHKIVPVKITEL